LKILLAVDGSPCNDKAVEKIARIVVGSHGYRAWERFLLGSVSQSIVSHARCSVEVVRCATVSRASKEPTSGKEKEQ
jgi:hypothetical protein